MLFALLAIPLGLALYIAFRIYRFLRRTHAPILQGKVKRRIRYKKGRRLDLYLPTAHRQAKTPVLIFLHGGGWVFGTRLSVNNTHFHGAFATLRAQGYAIVSPSYTLAKRNRSPFPACLEDVTDALRWLADHAEQYQFDLDNVGLLGESAGGHLALLMGFREPAAYGKGHTIPIRYVIDVFGPTHLYALYQDLLPFLNGLRVRVQRMPRLLRPHFDLLRKLFGFDPQEEPERARAFAEEFSPYNWVHAQGPPTLIIHGTYDRVVPFRQSQLLQERLETLGAAHRLQALAGVGHSFRGADVQTRIQLQKWVVDFVGSQYVAPQHSRIETVEGTD
jgi:acetyl esterase/lipase